MNEVTMFKVKGESKKAKEAQWQNEKICFSSYTSGVRLRAALIALSEARYLRSTCSASKGLNKTIPCEATPEKRPGMMEIGARSGAGFFKGSKSF